MKLKYTILISAAVLLGACNDGNKGTKLNSDKPFAKSELFYSYPYAGQENVSLNSPVVLRFADAIAGDLSPENVKLKCKAGVCEEGASGQKDGVVGWRNGDPTLVDDDKGLLLYTAKSLTANSEYCVEFEELELKLGGAINPKDGLCFSTRVAPDKRGSLAEYGATDDELKVVWTFPNLTGDATEPIMDFSTYRFRFNQPVQTDGVNYGDQVVLQQGDDEVEATMVLSRNMLSISPKEPLKAGKDYTISLSGIDALYEDVSLEDISFDFTPEDSTPRTILVQDTVQADPSEKCDASGAIKSVLTGEAINCVPMESVLLGDKDSTMQSGDVFAELAYLPNFVEVSPLRVPRGSLLTGTNIDVRVGGVIDANGDKIILDNGDEILPTIEEAIDKAGIMKTGDVSVSFISDATGYIYSNPYSTDADAPKQVRMFMDVAMTAEGMSANSSLSQDLLHVELNGMASLDGKSMQIDAIGIVEPDVLGTEVAFGFLSFQMKSKQQSDMRAAFEKQESDRDRWKAEKGPHVVASYPEKAALYEDTLEAPGFLLSDAITIQFNSPLDPNSIEADESFTLSKDGELFDSAEISWYLDGASFVVRPKEGFEADAEYELKLAKDGDSIFRGLPFPKITEDEDGDTLRYFFLKEEQGKPIDFGGNPDLTGVLTFRTPKIDNGIDEEFVDYTGYVKKGFDKEGDHNSFTPEPFRYPVILTAYPGYPCAPTWSESANEKIAHCIGDVDGFNSKVVIKPQELPANRPIRLTFSKPVHVPEKAFVVRDSENKKVPGKLSQTKYDLTFTPDKPWEIGESYRYRIETEAPSYDSDGVPESSCGEDSEFVCGENGYPLMTAPLAAQVILDGKNDEVNRQVDERYAFPPHEMFFVGAPNTKTVLQALRNTPTLDPAGLLTYYGDMDDKAEELDLLDDDVEIPNSTKLVFKARDGILQEVNLGCRDDDYEEECPANSYIHLAGNLNSEIIGPAKYECLYEHNNDDEDGVDYCVEATELDGKSFNRDENEITLENGEALAIGIYPTAIMTGSADVFAKIGLTGSFLDDILDFLGIVDAIAESEGGWLPSPTGIQVMRMHPQSEREGADEDGHPLLKDNPNGLIPGWIRNTSAGPVFETKVDLYLDAPYLAVLGGEGEHNQRNYPLTLDLRGPVEFLGDGRIQINQRNLNEAAVDVKLSNLTFNSTAEINLKIPQGKAFMLYQGEPVKE